MPLPSRSSDSFILNANLKELGPEPIRVLIDSGATKTFIDASLAARLKRTIYHLAKP
jgi:hypothetical protein